MRTGIFIIGCGDIGARVARLWLERNAAVSALCRSAVSADRLKTLGIQPVAGDLDKPESLRGLPTKGVTIYYLVPPPGEGDDDPRVAALLEAITTENLPSRIVYISTSGVYGDRKGAWVTEDVPPDPQTGRAKRRLAAETRFRRWGESKGVSVIVLRVGGIYGPDRLPIERLEKGLPVLRDQECGYTNRIHVDDLARVCVAAAEKGKAGRVYNVSDGHPGTMTQYFYAVADRLGLARPLALTMEEARKQLSKPMLSYLTESRRLDNRLMLKELGVELRYPDLASGLAAIR